MPRCYCHLSVPSPPPNSGQITTGYLSFSLSYCSQSNLFDVSLIQGACVQCNYFLPSLHGQSQIQSGHWTWSLERSAIEQQQISQLFLWLVAVWNVLALLHLTYIQRQRRIKGPCGKSVFISGNDFVFPREVLLNLSLMCRFCLVVLLLRCFLGFRYTRKTEVGMVKLHPHLSLPGP